VTIAIQPPLPRRATLSPPDATPVPSRSPALPVPDSWLDTLAKLVPGEIMVGFAAARQVPGVGDQLTAHLAILIVFATLVPVALRHSARRAGITAPGLQYVIRTASFVLYGLGSDRVLVAWLGDISWLPTIGGVAIALFAALVLVPPGAADPPPARD
jgi:hypothetical protein